MTTRGPVRSVQNRARLRRSGGEAGDRAAALAGVEHHRAPVQHRDLRDDRQPEAGARQRAGAGGAVEAVEHARRGPRRRSRARGRPPRACRRARVTVDRVAVGAELQRVVDEVGDGPVDHRLAAVDGARVVGVDHDLLAGAATEPRRHVVGHLAQRHRLHRLLAAHVGGELDHLAHQVGELVELEPGLGDELGPLLGVERGGVPEEVDVGAHRGERRAQLVAGVDDQALLLLARRVERDQHRVEAGGQPPDLVVAAHRDRRGEVLRRRDVLGGRR